MKQSGNNNSAMKGKAPWIIKKKYGASITNEEALIEIIKLIMENHEPVVFGSLPSKESGNGT